MILLILGLYFADIVKGLNFVLGLILIILVSIALAYILLFGIELDDGKPDNSIKLFKRCYKKYFAVLTFSILTFVALPSKNTIYIASGLVTGQKVMNQVQNNPLYEKSMKLLEKKIDEALTEETEDRKSNKKEDKK